MRHGQKSDRLWHVLCTVSYLEEANYASSRCRAHRIVKTLIVLPAAVHIVLAHHVIRQFGIAPEMYITQSDSTGEFPPHKTDSTEDFPSHRTDNTEDFPSHRTYSTQDLP